jgi:hypothetical protein
MPTNITQGNTVQFVVEFLDINGNLTIPPSGTLTIVYPTGTLTTSSTTIAMSANGSFWTASWGSSVSAYGDATWSVTAPGEPNPAATGALRIIDP